MSCWLYAQVFLANQRSTTLACSLTCVHWLVHSMPSTASPTCSRASESVRASPVRFKVVVGREDAKPFALTSPRRVPLPLFDKTKMELQCMENIGVITPVTEPTPWYVQIVVQKSFGALRICVYYTELNKSILWEGYPIPAVEHMLGRLWNVSWFSKIDPNSGFWQILLSERSKISNAVITPFGRLCFNRLPFGVSSAPEHF